MKAKLCAALVAAGCVLAVSPANAISVTINPMATTTSVPGAVLFDDFDSIQDTAIGTITGGFVKGPASGGPGSPVATGNFIIADGLLGSPLNVTVTFTNPVAYAGFAWGTPDPFNELDVYNGSTPLGSFFGIFSQNQPTYYFNLFAGSGEAITKLVMSSTIDSTINPSGCCFETDNYSAAINLAVPGPIAGAGLPGLILASGGLLGWWPELQGMRRLR